MSDEEFGLYRRLIHASEGLRFWVWDRGQWFECNVLRWWMARQQARAVCRSTTDTPVDSRVAMRTRRVKAAA